MTLNHRDQAFQKQLMSSLEVMKKATADTESRLYNMERRDAERDLDKKYSAVLELLKQFGGENISGGDIQELVASSKRIIGQKGIDRDIAVAFEQTLANHIGIGGEMVFNQIFDSGIRSIAEDRRLLAAMVPTIARGIDTYISAILNSNTMSDDIGLLPLTLDDYPDSDSIAKQSIRTLLKDQYKIDPTMIKNIVTRTLMDGYFYVSTMPYKYVVTRAAYKAIQKTEKGMTRELSSVPGMANLTELLKTMKGNSENSGVHKDEQTNATIIDLEYLQGLAVHSDNAGVPNMSFADVDSNAKMVNFSDSYEKMLDNSFSGDDKKEVREVLSQNKDFFSRIADKITVSENPVEYHQRLMKREREVMGKVRRLERGMIDGAVSENLPNEIERLLAQEMPGCVVRYHLREEVIPLELNGKIYGYIVKERGSRILADGDSLVNNVTSLGSLETVGSATGGSRGHTLLEGLFSKDGDVLSAIHNLFGYVIANKMGNLDLERNPQYKDLVYELVNYYANSENMDNEYNTNIYFMPEKWMVRFGNGESILDPVFFAAKWLAIVIGKDLLTHITRGDGDRTYSVSSEVSDKNNVVKPTAATEAFRRQIQNRSRLTSFGAVSAGSIPSVLAGISAAKDNFAPMLNDKKQIQVDMQERMNSIDSTLREMLERMVAIGMKLNPSAMSDNDNSPTATEVLMNNDAFRRVIFLLKVIVSEGLTTLVQNIWRFHNSSSDFTAHVIMKLNGLESLVLIPSTEEKKKKASSSLALQVPASKIRIAFSNGIAASYGGKEEMIRPIQSFAEAMFASLEDKQKQIATRLFIRETLGPIMDFKVIDRVIEESAKQVRTEKARGGDEDRY